MRTGGLATALFAAAFAALSVAPARAAPSVHLEWGDCGASGTSLRTFACDTNVGAEQLVVSFVPPGGVTEFSGLEVRLQLMPVDQPQPPWWQLATGGCRAGALSSTFNFAPLATCADPYDFGGAGGAIASAVTPGEIRMVGARAVAGPLDSTLQYYAGIILVPHARSTGAGSCAGCELPRGVFIKSFSLHGPQGQIYDYIFNVRSAGVLPAYVNWQCPGEPRFELDWEKGYLLSGWDFSDCPTAARRSSWGAVKSLYR